MLTQYVGVGRFLSQIAIARCLLLHLLDASRDNTIADLSSVAACMTYSDNCQAAVAVTSAATSVSVAASMN